MKSSFLEFYLIFVLLFFFAIYQIKIYQLNWIGGWHDHTFLYQNTYLL